MKYFSDLSSEIKYVCFILIGVVAGLAIHSFLDPSDSSPSKCAVMDKDLAGYDWNIARDSGMTNYGVEGNMYSSSNDPFTTSINDYNLASSSGTGITPDQMTQSVKISWRLLETVIRQMNLSTTPQDTFIYFRFGLIDTAAVPSRANPKMLTVFAGSNSLTSDSIIGRKRGYIYASPDGSTTYCPNVCPIFN